MISLIQSGISVFGLFSINPALLAFLTAVFAFGALNLLEFKRFD